jgi:acyl-[acyl-carrier-protein]-phospholipid O-acyltransferase/long-chain-fatty-acid--[acyl-carrier-protein] ligase
MVPHIKVEEALQEAMRIEETAFAVTGVPDGRRGERLAVLHTLQNGTARIAAERLQNSGLPRLWIPRPSDFVRVEAIPVLGTGKLDLRKIRALAEEALSPDALEKGAEAPVS